MNVPRSRSIAGALVVVLAIVARGHAADAPAGPQWLRAPRERGPLAGTIAFDGRTSWGIDTAIPLGRPSLAGAPRSRFALGMSIAGRGIDGSQDLRFAALMDGRRNRSGLWLGTAGAGSGAPGGRLHVGAGLWRSFAPIELEAGVVTSAVEARHNQMVSWRYPQWPDTLNLRDTSTVQAVGRNALWTTAQTALRWRRGRVEMGTIGGVTVGEGTSMRRWAQATVHLQTSSRMLLLAAYGQRPPASLAFDPTARPRTMVGLQMALWASPDWAMAGALTPSVRDWRTRMRQDGRLVAFVRSRDARMVELIGDFTDWTPVRLTALEGGWWTGTFDVPPGLHQVQVRLDNGSWLAPPRLPRTTGEFAGEAGVIVVE